MPHFALPGVPDNVNRLVAALVATLSIVGLIAGMVGAHNELSSGRSNQPGPTVVAVVPKIVDGEYADITIGSTTHTKSVDLLKHQNVSFDLGGNFTAVEATLRMDRGTENAIGSVVFSGDGETLETVNILATTPAEVSVELDVTSVDTLTVRTDLSGTGNDRAVLLLSPDWTYQN